MDKNRIPDFFDKLFNDFFTGLPQKFQVGDIIVRKHPDVMAGMPHTVSGVTGTGHAERITIVGVPGSNSVERFDLVQRFGQSAGFQPGDRIAALNGGSVYQVEATGVGCITLTGHRGKYFRPSDYKLVNRPSTFTLDGVKEPFKTGDQIKRNGEGFTVSEVVIPGGVKLQGHGEQIFLASSFDLHTPPAFKVGDRVERTGQTIRINDGRQVNKGQFYTVSKVEGNDLKIAGFGGQWWLGSNFKVVPKSSAPAVAPSVPPMRFEVGGLVRRFKEYNFSEARADMKKGRVYKVEKVSGGSIKVEGLAPWFGVSCFEPMTFKVGDRVVRVCGPIQDPCIVRGKSYKVVAVNGTPRDCAMGSSSIKVEGSTGWYSARYFKLESDVMGHELGQQLNNDIVSQYIKAIDDKHPTVQPVALSYRRITEADLKPSAFKETGKAQQLKANEAGGKKDDSGKLDWTLLPIESIEAVIRVLTFGANKYGRNNWSKVEAERYIKAAFRHLSDYTKGEDTDADTGESHMAHLACCALFLISQHADAIKARKAGGVGCSPVGCPSL